MTPRARQQAAFANPVLIGAVTVLVAIVAVFLAYNANNGLPFVPTRQLRIQFANGAALGPGDQVTSTGGFRIGVVSDTKAVRCAATGVPCAEAEIKLDRSFGPVPVNSTAAITPRNLFGTKYVDLERGTSRQTIPDGGVLPESQITIKMLDGEDGRVDLGPTDLEPEVVMTMEADTAHKFWLGKVNVTVALARGQMKAKGPVAKILKLVPLTKPVFPRYKAQLEAAGRDDLVNVS